MRVVILAIFLFTCNVSFADIYAIYDKDTGEIVNVIVYDGIAEYNEKAGHGNKAKKVKFPKIERDKDIGIGDEYKNGKFKKKEE